MEWSQDGTAEKMILIYLLIINIEKDKNKSRIDFKISVNEKSLNQKAFMN